MISEFPTSGISTVSNSSGYFLTSNGKPLFLEEMIFFDIETVHGCKSYEEFCETQPELVPIWEKYASYYKGKTNSDLTNSELYISRAALMPEFGKIVCISVNYMSPVFEKEQDTFYFENKEVSFVGEEQTILISINLLLDGIINKFKKLKSQIYKNLGRYPEIWLVGHYASIFDIPFIKNRCIINQIKPHPFLIEDGKKPWDIRIKDTKILWRCNSGYPGVAGLNDICVVLGVKPPKESMDGSMVSKVFYDLDNSGKPLKERLEIIAEYCEGYNYSLKEVVKKHQNLKTFSYG